MGLAVRIILLGIIVDFHLFCGALFHSIDDDTLIIHTTDVANRINILYQMQGF